MKLIGRTITGIREMTDEEKRREGWDDWRYRTMAAIVLDNGAVLYASQDEEGNGPGVFFGADSEGESFMVTNQEKS